MTSRRDRCAYGRINLAYGGDDITTALSAILAKSSFPYRDLNLARSQDWIMMDNLKIKICTLEEVSQCTLASDLADRSNWLPVHHGTSTCSNRRA
jgi:actin-related protein